MGTKWKNRFLIGTFIILLTFGLSGLMSLFNERDRYMQQDYFQSSEFQFILNHYIQYLNMFELNYVPLREAIRNITVTEDDIMEYRNRYDRPTDLIANIRAQYDSLILEAVATENQEVADAYIAERDAEVEDIINLFKSDVQVRRKIIEEKEQILESHYLLLEGERPEYLKYKDGFLYHIENNDTGEVYTNLKLSGADTGEAVLKDESMHKISFSSAAFKGEIGVSRSISPSHFIMVHYEDYKQLQIIFITYMLASAAALILCFYLARKAYAASIPLGKWIPYYNKLPIDFRVVLLLTTAWGAASCTYFVTEQVYYTHEHPLFYALNIIGCLILAAAFVALALFQGKYLAAQLKAWNGLRGVWESALLYKTGRWIKRCVHNVMRSLKNAFWNRSTGTQLFIILTLVFGLGLAGSMVVADEELSLIYIALLGLIGIPIVVIVIRWLGYFNLIVRKMNELAAGNPGQSLPDSGRGILAGLARNMNTLKQGVKTLQTEQAKSERLKTELITNVSHDLRTPLTSIITYAELLKRDDLSVEDRAAYIEIIDRKSKRLKVIIDDLFEVSKMASGNAELTKEKVDLVQLLQQALAEYDNAINESSLDFRLMNSEQSIYALVDGKKLWRVFDNLIGNILNYSLERSRAYITIRTDGQHAVITFKNVSKYELSENSDELFERFKRGDTSRHTEGSGLGLAIAKSIVDLHEGSLDIENDGDLFKVNIRLQLEQ